MECSFVESQIVSWLTKKLESTKQKGFVVGISGGIDSALVSTLCAKTGKPTIVVSLPIAQNTLLADRHMAWLTSKYPNVKESECNLTGSLYSLEGDIWADLFDHNTYCIDTGENRDLVSANLRSRLRMCALYAFANASGFLVVGTGNKVEDYGVGFFTKHGDGGVDISPIGDLFKSEVRELASYLGIDSEIVKAAPTDGLWADSRTDEDQIGATYDELEWAMSEYGRIFCLLGDTFEEKLKTAQRMSGLAAFDLSDPRKQEVLKIFHQRHVANRHKMSMPPVCLVER